MPLCDSSQTYARALWLWPSPADLRSGWTTGVSEVSRFSCMKFLGVSGVFDYAGLSRSSRCRACSCCLPRITRTSASGLHLFGAEYPPRLSSVYASLCTSRYPAQDSRPSGSLLLSRKELSSSASCRFIPAHCNRDISTVKADQGDEQKPRDNRQEPVSITWAHALGPCLESGSNIQHRPESECRVSRRH